MPTVLKKRGYRFFFYSNDHSPVHIHIEKENCTAKFQLEPVKLLKSKGFSARDINEIRKFVTEHQEYLITKWNEYFNRK